MKTKLFLILAIVSLLLVACAKTPTTTNSQAEKSEFTVYKSANCGCCGGYVSMLKEQGLTVETINVQDTTKIKKEHNIPDDMLSCHTTVVGKYFIEGHVPYEAVEKLLREQPDIDGIALPGMPAGSPGMSGAKRGTWTIFAIKDGQTSVFMEV